MNSKEAKQIAGEGLERRREARNIADREAVLDQYEEDQIRACNVHFADAKIKRQLEETGRLSREQMAARKAARDKAQAEKIARELAAEDAIKKYITACLAIFCLTIFTHLPVWAAATLTMGLAVFPSAHIFRLYYPPDQQK